MFCGQSKTALRQQRTQLVLRLAEVEACFEVLEVPGSLTTEDASLISGLLDDELSRVSRRLSQIEFALAGGSRIHRRCS